MPVETVVARNTLDGILIIGSDVNANHVKWEAAGDPDGGDIQFVPADLAATAGFRKALARKLIILEEDESSPEIVETLERQLVAFQRRQDGRAEAAQEALHKETNRDMVSKGCAGPDSRGTGLCGVNVPVNDRTKDDKAPLCAKHEHLRSEYVPEELISNGDSTIQWVRVSITKREKA